jgi:hypothetical protein
METKLQTAMNGNIFDASVQASDDRKPEQGCGSDKQRGYPNNRIRSYRTNQIHHSEPSQLFIIDRGANVGDIRGYERQPTVSFRVN